MRDHWFCLARWGFRRYEVFPSPDRSPSAKSWHSTSLAAFRTSYAVVPAVGRNDRFSRPRHRVRRGREKRF